MTKSIRNHARNTVSATRSPKGGVRKAPAEPYGVVGGIVAFATGQPAPGCTVRALDRDLVRERELGTSVTDANGQYKIGYARMKWKGVEKSRADLVVRVLDHQGGVLASSPLHPTAPLHAVIDLRLELSAPEPAEYDRLLADISPRLQGTSLADLALEEIQYLSRVSGWDAKTVQILSDSAHLSRKLSAHSAGQLSGAVFYAWVRQGLPADAQAFVRQSRGWLASALVKARDGGVIADPELKVIKRYASAHSKAASALVTGANAVRVVPQDWPALAAELVWHTRVEQELAPSARLGALTVYDLFSKSTEPSRSKSASAALAPKKLRVLAELVSRDGAERPPSAEALGAHGFSSVEQERIRRTFALAELTRNHLPLIRSLGALASGTPMGSVHPLSYLAALTADDWHKLVAAAGSPQGVSGETKSEQQAAYAAALEQGVENASRTAVLAARIGQGRFLLPEIVRSDLVAFFAKDPEFTFRSHSVQRWFGSKSQADLQGFANPAALKRTLLQLERTVKLTDNHRQHSALLARGFDSAQKICRVGKRNFLRQMGSHPDVGEPAARAIYARASYTAAAALHLAMRYRNDGFRPAALATMPAVRTQTGTDPVGIAPESVPDLETLFGSLDGSACDPNLSVLSPAAYLVDLLHYLQDHKVPWITISTPSEDQTFFVPSNTPLVTVTVSGTFQAVGYADAVVRLVSGGHFSDAVVSGSDFTGTVAMDPSYPRITAKLVRPLATGDSPLSEYSVTLKVVTGQFSGVNPSNGTMFSIDASTTTYPLIVSGSYGISGLANPTVRVTLNAGEIPTTQDQSFSATTTIGTSQSTTDATFTLVLQVKDPSGGEWMTLDTVVSAIHIAKREITGTIEITAASRAKGFKVAVSGTYTIEGSSSYTVYVGNDPTDDYTKGTRAGLTENNGERCFSGVFTPSSIDTEEGWVDAYAWIVAHGTPDIEIAETCRSFKLNLPAPRTQSESPGSATSRQHLPSRRGQIGGALETVPEIIDNPPSLLDLLRMRRPDLVQTELSVANSTTVVPYVDLVLEILENAVAAPIPPTFPQTTETQGEIELEPEHFNPLAYETLKQAGYPWSLPLDLWTEQARSHLRWLGVPREELQEAFHRGPSFGAPECGSLTPARAAAAPERFGLIASDMAILSGRRKGTGPENDPNTGLWNFWGFCAPDLSDANSIPDPADSTKTLRDGNWLHVLSGRVDVVLQQAGLSYAELRELLDMRYVNTVDGNRRVLELELGTAQIAAADPRLVPSSDLRLASLVRLDAAFTDDDVAGVFDRLHRFVRLWRKAKWPMRELDRAIRIGSGSARSGHPALDEALVATLDRSRELSQGRLHRTENLLSLFANAPYRDYGQPDQPLVAALYESLFLDKSIANAPDTAFELDAEGDQTKNPDARLAEHLSQVAAACGLSLQDAALAAKWLDIEPHLTLDHLSSFFFAGLVARETGISVADLLQLHLLGVGEPLDRGSDGNRQEQASEQPQELGTRFTSVTGYIVSLRYWKPANEIGGHVGSLWSADGVLLARVVFQNETKSGWQEQRLPWPVWVEAHGSYIVSVNANAWLATNDHDQGVCGIPGSFPTTLADGIGYLRDIRFLPNQIRAEDVLVPQAIAQTGFDPGEAVRLLSHHQTDGDAETEVRTATGILEALRRDLSAIARETALPEVVMDPDGQGTRRELDTLGWHPLVIAEVFETLNETFSVPLAQLPDGVILPTAAVPQVTFAAGALATTKRLTDSDRRALAGLSADPAYLAAVQALFDLPSSPFDLQAQRLGRDLSTYDARDVSAPLDAWPTGLVLPADLSPRMYYDAIAKQLHFVGAIDDSTGSRLQELASSLEDGQGSQFLSAMTILRDGYRSPPDGVAPLLDAQGCAALLDLPRPAGRFAFLLEKLVGHRRQSQSRKALQNRLASSLDLDSSLADRLLNEWIRSASGPASGSAASDFLQPDFVLGNPALPVTAERFPAAFRSFVRLSKVATLVSKFRLTEVSLAWLFGRTPDPVGWLDPNLLPAGSDESPVSIRPFLRVANLFALRGALPGGEETLAGIFAAATSSGLDRAAFLERISDLAGWNLDDLSTLLGPAGFAIADEDLEAAFRDEILLGRLVRCFATIARLGATAAQCLEWSKPEITPDAAADIRRVARSRHTESTWAELARATQAELRETRREALVAYLIGKDQLRDSNDLYDYYLIDVEMQPTARTTRIKQACASVQLFVQRCLLDLESGATPETIDTELWAWMKNYRVWEANRKIFLFPENWIEPELRDDKSQFFSSLESDLLQSNVTHEAGLEAFKSYVEKLGDVARLTVVGMCEEGLNDNTRLVHVLARDGSAPHRYFYRQWDAVRWTAWEEVSAGIDSDHVLVFLFAGSVHIAWPTILADSDSGQPSQTGADAKPRMKITMNVVRRQRTGWSAPKCGQGQILWTLPQASFSPAPDTSRWLAFQVNLPPEDASVLYIDAFAGLDSAAPTDLVQIGRFELADSGTLGVLDDPSASAGSKFVPDVPIDNVGPYNSIYRENGPGGDLVYRIPPGAPITLLDKSPGAFCVVGNSSRPEKTSLLGYSDNQFDLVIQIDLRAGKIQVVPSTFPWLQDLKAQIFNQDLTGAIDVQQWPPKPLNLDPAISNPITQVEVGFAAELPWSIYNWETFFHVPILVATQLTQNQRFEEAQKWLHLVFDPTSGKEGTDARRFWRFKPFLDEEIGSSIEQELAKLSAGADQDLRNQIADWKKNPFQPHRIARSRHRAYQFFVLRKYLDNLIAWGDQLFQADTIESINEATQLYVLASEILGRRPRQIATHRKADSRTYDQLPALDDFSNALVQIESLIPAPAGTVGSSDTPPILYSLYFGIPANDQLAAYWDTVEDRLFKIRHSLNIEGVARTLALYEPPIDPALLVRATAAGVDIASALADLQGPLPHYRFHITIQKALELAGDVKAFGASLLSALEKQDAENLALLRSTQEIALLKLVQTVKERQRDEAQASVDSLRKTRELIAQRYLQYQRLLGKTNITVPAEGAIAAVEDTPSKAVAVRATSSEDTGGLGLSTNEDDHLSWMDEANQNSFLGGIFHTAAGVAFALPNVTVKAAFCDFQHGGMNLGSALDAVGSFFNLMSSNASHHANRAATIAGHQRRYDEWAFQSNLAAKELEQVDKQIVAAEIRVAIADQELTNHQKQMDNAREVDDFMHDKFSNAQLYRWMGGQASSLYFRAFQIAYDMAKRAEKAFRFELGLADSDTSFIQFGYWDSLKKGLFAGEQLALDLRRMDVAYLDRNKREMEITKHVSLRQLDAGQLFQLRKNGTCDFVLPEELFAMDFPGHYFRRLKSVSVSLPCVVGPYTSVSGTLTLLGSTLRTVADPAVAAVPVSQVGIQSIATSGAQNDSGLFDLNFHDERYLPFEGAGAASRWHFELPKGYAVFDYSTITDLVLHVRYTARDGGQSANASVTHWLGGSTDNLALLVSLRQDFPAEWAKARQTPGKSSFSLDLTNFFPYFARVTPSIVSDGIQYAAQSAGAPQLTLSDLNVSHLTLGFTADISGQTDVYIIVPYTVGSR